MYAALRDEDVHGYGQLLIISGQARPLEKHIPLPVAMFHDRIPVPGRTLLPTSQPRAQASSPSSKCVGTNSLAARRGRSRPKTSAIIAEVCRVILTSYQRDSARLTGSVMLGIGGPRD